MRKTLALALLAPIYLLVVAAVGCAGLVVLVGTWLDNGDEA
ncbi:MAG TPA: hypothetical protein VN017_05480 [Pseudoxanthomonas sp.]|nr:hypothetical protein [Pseudoxanthomonas sp.]